jgi:hypothetical protein
LCVAITPVGIGSSFILFRAVDWRALEPVRWMRFWDGKTTVFIDRPQAQVLGEAEDHDLVSVEFASADTQTEPAGSRSVEVGIAVTEAEHVWERFRDLEQRNRSNLTSLFKLFTVLIAFASAPFTFESFTRTGLSRVWGICGLWVALVAWIYADRTFRSYGRHLFERVFCLRQLRQYRRLLLGRWPEYSRYSLFSDRNLDKDKAVSAFPERVERSQVVITLYFYKTISAFFPFYTVLFVSLILAPELILDSGTLSTRSIYTRFALGFSAITFAWLVTSSRRCRGLLEAAFCARRISRTRPWPVFPSDERLALWKGRTVLARVIVLAAVALAATNLARMIYLLVARPDGTGWWRGCDWYLLAVSGLGLVVMFVHSEIDVRYVLGRAKDVDPAPVGHTPDAT